MNLQITLSRSHLDEFLFVNRLPTDQNLFNINRRRQRIESIRSDHHDAFDRRKPESAVAVFPAGWLTAAIGFTALHTIADAVRNRSDCCQEPVCELVQFFETDAIDTPVTTHPEVVAFINQDP